MAETRTFPPRPQTEFVPPDFGPDASTTPKDPPKINQKHPPKPSLVDKLGTNKKVRSPVRKLTRDRPKENELSDLERLENWYLRIGRAARPFHPKFATAMEEQANDCANCWFDLAENNDNVRRWILAMIEGGDWGKVLSAHTPILLAVLPERTLNRLLLKGAGLFFRAGQEDEEENDEFTPWGPQ